MTGAFLRLALGVVDGCSRCFFVVWSCDLSMP